MLFKFNTFSHVINIIPSLYVLALSMIFTEVVACMKLNPDAYIIYSSSFACDTDSPSPQNGIYSMYVHRKHDAGFAVALQSSAFGQLPGQVQFSQKQSYKERSSCQTFAQYKFL